MYAKIKQLGADLFKISKNPTRKFKIFHSKNYITGNLSRFFNINCQQKTVRGPNEYYEKEYSQINSIIINISFVSLHKN